LDTDDESVSGELQRNCTGIAPSIGGLSILITDKVTAYGVSVVVAFAAAIVLLVAAPISASADKGTTAGGATTIDNAAAGVAVTITSTHVSGTELCADGTFALVAGTNVGGTAAAPINQAGGGQPDGLGCLTTKTTVSIAMLTTSTSVTVASTTGFPDSGSLMFDVDGDDDLGSGGTNNEIVDYTSKTATSFDGLIRAQAGTTARANIVTSTVYPIKYSVLTVAAVAATVAGTLSVVDATGWVAGAGPELILAPGKAASEAVVVTAKSGTSFTHVATTGTHAVGTYVAQVSAVNTDKATVLFTRTASTTTTGSFQFLYTAQSLASTKGTQTLTIITDEPTADAISVTVSATTPVAPTVLVSLTGNDKTEISKTPSFSVTVLPTQGVLGTVGAAVCTDVALAVQGAVMTNCVSQVNYTPLLGATGTDTFSFTFTNGAEVSVAAVGTITLPAAPVVVAAPPLTGGFAATLGTGVNLTTYGGGTVAELGADGVAAGATSISVTIDGAFIVYVVSAPEFVNAAFNAQYPTSVANGTVVLVVK
jgi:hypothetical protein